MSLARFQDSTREYSLGVQAPVIFRRPVTSMELVPDLEAYLGALEGAVVVAQATGMQREYMELPTLVR